jgi:hypothetical protein
MKWTAPAALLATALLAGPGKAQNFTYGSSYHTIVGMGSTTGLGSSGGGYGTGLTWPANYRLGGFGIAGFGAGGYRLAGTFNNFAIHGAGSVGPFGSISSFGNGGLGSGAILANLMPQIHYHGPLFNYGPYYGYPPFEPYGPWDAYLRYHPPVAAGGGGCFGPGCFGGGNPNPLCGRLCDLCKRRGSNAQGATDAACGGMSAARCGDGWGAASGGCSASAVVSPTATSGAAAAVQTNAVPVFSRYAGVGSPAGSSAYYQGTPVPSVAAPK